MEIPTTDQNNVQPIGGKTPRTRASIVKAIEGELAAARLKEATGKIKSKVIELNAAKAIVAGLEEEIATIMDDYADVLPE
jgi:hypothetical protein